MAENDDVFECEARHQEEAIYMSRNVSKFGSTEDEVQRKYSKWAQHFDKVQCNMPNTCYELQLSL